MFKFIVYFITYTCIIITFIVILMCIIQVSMNIYHTLKEFSWK